MQAVMKDVATITSKAREIRRLAPSSVHRAGERPTLIVVHTTKGRGVAFMEGNFRWHAGLMTEEGIEASVLHLPTIKPYSNGPGSKLRVEEVDQAFSAVRREYRADGVREREDDGAGSKRG
jgi:transketolase